MNKKLFSWKALAGLALLVAMGLTSCKQGTEVDPENPTPEKPVTPTIKGTELSGFKTVAELNKLLAEKDITDQIKADAEVTITLDCSNLKAAAGDEIVIPGKDDATINLVFANAFKENKGVVISDAALDVVNIEFPSEDMGDFAFDMDYSKLTLSSAGATTLGTVGIFTNKNKDKKLATTIEDGITIEVFKNWDDTKVYEPIIVDGAEIEALYVDGDLLPYYGWWIQNDDNGFWVPGTTTDLKDGDDVFVKDLYISEDATIGCYQSKKKTVANKFTVAEGVTLTLAGGYVNEVVGEGDTGAIVDYNGGIEEYGRGAAFSNVTLDGHGRDLGSSNDPTESTFTNCTMVDFDWIFLSQESATGLKIKQDNDISATRVYYPIYADASDLVYSYEFSKCEFSGSTRVYTFAEGDNVLDKNGDPIIETLYKYGDYTDDEGNYTYYKEGLEKLSDVPAAVRKGEQGWYESYTYEPKVYSFDDLSLIPSFSECKFDGVAVSDKQSVIDSQYNGLLNFQSLAGEDGTAVATTPGVIIGDKAYKRIWSKSNGYILVEQ